MLALRCGSRCEEENKRRSSLAACKNATLSGILTFLPMLSMGLCYENKCWGLVEKFFGFGNWIEGLKIWFYRFMLLVMYKVLMIFMVI